MSFAYIKRRYGVDLQRGDRIVTAGLKMKGTVTAANGPFVRVLFDGAKFNRNWHPCELEKIDAGAK